MCVRVRVRTHVCVCVFVDDAEMLRTEAFRAPLLLRQQHLQLETTAAPTRPWSHHHLQGVTPLR